MTPYIWQKTNLTEAVKALNPSIVGDFDKTATRIITDTRKINQGDIFLAIQGDNFDGHDYVETAKDKGAVLAIVSRQIDSDIPQLIVNDTKLALGQLGKYRRDAHPDLTVIAITGSSGKTTVKEMLGSIFSQIAPTLITRGNLNNDLGVPMMLLELTDEHKFAIMELGANHVGEIAYTTRLVSPDVACVLNIGTAHLGEFGGRENIAKTKAEIFEGLQDQGISVLPFGDEFFDVLADKASQFSNHIITFGERQVPLKDAGVDMSSLHELGLTEEDTIMLASDVFADDMEIFADHSEFSVNINLTEDEVKSADVCLNFAGEHNISNALSATACGIALKIDLTDIIKGLNTAKPAKGRLNFKPFGEHLLIDDTYNANVPAMLAGAKVLIEQDGYKVLVLGDIGELGDDAISEHEKLGEALADMPIDKLLVVGDLMKNTAKVANQTRADFATHFVNKTDLAKHLQATLANQNCAVLFKGSRFMAMETLIDEIVAKG
ncbi:UDP-N-acetylmuramoyl-tripeptide--D-alanyl-D-alanine ligase [Faucicola boevrei]|uniref:UDP-N-acetylmuramoyl-tripeptide--D-alanyl-D- alanine ligase n=1 Tax=Faucicola boevrei TaxID=346665 RepID=UPI00036C7BB5|nr:UDP-N-acetylmuramoyl-tripeptide--D-alanyl-D-alanine ligase [Moraxella boevrei]